MTHVTGSLFLLILSEFWYVIQEWDCSLSVVISYGPNDKSSKIPLKDFCLVISVSYLMNTEGYFSRRGWGVKG
jgi:hypothetical protein